VVAFVQVQEAVACANVTGFDTWHISSTQVKLQPSLKTKKLVLHNPSVLF